MATLTLTWISQKQWSFFQFLNQIIYHLVDYDNLLHLKVRLNILDSHGFINSLHAVARRGYHPCQIILFAKSFEQVFSQVRFQLYFHNWKAFRRYYYYAAPFQKYSCFCSELLYFYLPLSRMTFSSELLLVLF